MPWAAGWVRCSAGLPPPAVTASARLQEEQHHRGRGREHDQLGPVADLWGAGKLVRLAEAEPSLGSLNHP